MNQQMLPMPNPGDWLDTFQAMAILEVSRTTLWKMADDGLLGKHKVGAVALYWRPEVLELAAARARSKPRRA